MNWYVFHHWYMLNDGIRLDMMMMNVMSMNIVGHMNYNMFAVQGIQQKREILKPLYPDLDS